MEYLKLHTEDELDRMPAGDYSKYERALDDTTSKLGIIRITVTEMEQELLNLVDSIKNPKTELGVKHSAVSREKKADINYASRQIEKCRKAVVDELLDYVGKGALRLSKVIHSTSIYGSPCRFDTISWCTFLDPITESYEEHTLMCNMFNGPETTFVWLRDLPLVTLMEIIDLIKADDAVLCSTADNIIYYRGIDEPKAVLQASGLLESEIL